MWVWYLWGRRCPWRMSATEELSSGFTAMEHLSCDSVSLPQASTYIRGHTDCQHRGGPLWHFKALSSPVRQDLSVPVASVLV